MINVRDFGALGDGWTDDSPALKDALDAVRYRGGGKVYFPQGVYISSQHIMGASGVHIVGDGQGHTVIKRQPGSAPMSVFNFSEMDHWSVRDLTIDGSSVASSGHGIRATECSDFSIENVRIHDVSSYAIGFQDGAIKRARLTNLTLERTGADGIDIKNKANANDAIILDNVIVIDPGMRKLQSAAIDLRGPCLCSNIVVRIKTSPNLPNGIRHRSGSAERTNGIGAQWSTLTNFHIEGAGATGVVINHRDIKVSSGTVRGFARGVVAYKDGCRIAGVTAEGCGVGFEDQGVNNEWSGCNSLNSLYDGFHLRGSIRTRIIGGQVTGSGADGFRSTDAKALTIIGTTSRSNGGADWPSDDALELGLCPGMK